MTSKTPKDASRRSLQPQRLSGFLKETLDQGTVALQKGDTQTAMRLFEMAVDQSPEHAVAWHLSGLALHQAGQHVEAINAFQYALKLNPTMVASHLALGELLMTMADHQKALQCFNDANSLDRQQLAGRLGRANALLALDRNVEALTAFDYVIQKDAKCAKAYTNKARTLSNLGQPKAAMKCLDMAIQMEPPTAENHFLLGSMYLSLKMYNKAVAQLSLAIELAPDDANAYAARGAAFAGSQKRVLAVADYERALAMDSDLPYLAGNVLGELNVMCNWAGYARRIDEIIMGVNAGKKIIQPLTLMQVSDDPDLQLQCAKIFAGPQHDDSNSELHKRVRENKKIKIAYYSSDFQNHPVTHLMEKIFELHDRNKFEIIGFSLASNPGDEFNTRLRKIFDRYISIHDFDESTVVELSIEMCIDIAVDLNGYTGGASTAIFRERCAPIQISFLGYPGTMALNQIDYIMADNTIITKENRKFYTEKVIYLPDCYQPNNWEKKISSNVIDRKICKLPEKSFVFCCFNNPNKITPDVFEIWMNLLLEVPESVIWLSSGNKVLINNLRQHAVTAGVEPSRLVFAERLPSLEDHLARYKLADLFLDTFPYNAHTTASDALWGGLPVLTRAGQSYVSRVAASLLHAVGLDELVTCSADDYVKKAMQIANNPKILNDLKTKLESNRLAYPLFDSKKFTKNIELMYVNVYERWKSGLKVDDVSMSSDILLNQ